MTSRAATALSNDSCGDDGEAVCLKNQVGFLSHPPRDRRGCFLGLRSLPQGSAGACRSCRDTGRHGASHLPGQGKGSGSSWTQIPSPCLPLGPHCPALGVPGPISGEASPVLASRSARPPVSAFVPTDLWPQEAESDVCPGFSDVLIPGQPRKFRAKLGSIFCCTQLQKVREWGFLKYKVQGRQDTFSG